MKFLSTSKAFGMFEQPDFTDPKSWVHHVFNQLGSSMNLPDIKKAEIWMTYRSRVKEQFSLHWSSVTQNLKNLFLKGEVFVSVIYSYSEKPSNTHDIHFLCPTFIYIFAQD